MASSSESSPERTGLPAMRRFVADVMSDRPSAPGAEAPPLPLLQIAHMAPLAYKRGYKQFQGDYAATLIVAGRRAQVLAEVVTAFTRRGIAIAPIKGAAFLGTIYPDPAERPMNDIDVLVPVPQIPDAMRTMLDIGFERTGFARKLSGFYHAVVFIRGEVMFELHRNIVQAYRTRMNLDEIWRRAARQPSGAHRLDPVDELLFAALHIARHELAAHAINYVDIQRLWARLDPRARAEAHARAREWRITRSFETVLAMTDMLARGERGTPAGGVAARFLPSTDDILLGTRPTRARQIAQKLWLTEGTRERLGLGVAWAGAIAEGWWRARSYQR